MIKYSLNCFESITGHQDTVQHMRESAVAAKNDGRSNSQNITPFKLLTVDIWWKSRIYNAFQSLNYFEFTVSQLPGQLPALLALPTNSQPG